MMTKAEFLAFNDGVAAVCNRIGATYEAHWHAHISDQPGRINQSVVDKFGHATLVIEGPHYKFEYEHIETWSAALSIIESFVFKGKS